MTNQEKYKTAEEREKAFSQFCSENTCGACPLNVTGDCRYPWLGLETPNDNTASKDNIIKKHFTNRGFVIGEFEDLYGAKCSIQESSLAEEPAIWLGVHKPEISVMSVDAKSLPPPKIVPDAGSGKNYGWSKYILPEKVSVFSRMHLDIDMAKELVELLNYFIENGTLPQDGISNVEDNKHENRD